METNYKINKNAITKSILKVQEDKINTNILKTKQKYKYNQINNQDEINIPYIYDFIKQY